MRFLDWLTEKTDGVFPRAQRYPCVLCAYYWDGGRAVTGDVKDISESGAYVVTSERWYPGTILRLTLHFETAGTDVKSPASITVPCKVVRHGQDGMGISFVYAGSEDRKASQHFIDRVPRRDASLQPVEVALMVPMLFLLLFNAIHLFK
jgi:hypothetical protein